MPAISSASEVSEFVAEANAIGRVDFTKQLAFLNSYTYVPKSNPPLDAESGEFLDWQLGLWKEVSGRQSYAPEQDESDNNVTFESGLRNPYPFCSEDGQTVGNYLSAIGLAIKGLSLKPGEKVIEFGVGWAHTTINLARCGYRVTALDIERKFLDILRYRAEREGLKISMIHGGFLDFPCGKPEFDGALFFESFHHCLEFKQLLRRLRAALLPGGRLVFCGEAFYGDWFPYPWGIRLDGHSVWAIRNFGWMELGFRETYIVGVLEGLGFKVVKFDNNIGPIGIVFVARL